MNRELQKDRLTVAEMLMMARGQRDNEASDPPVVFPATRTPQVQRLDAAPPMDPLTEGRAELPKAGVDICHELGITKFRAKQPKSVGKLFDNYKDAASAINRLAKEHAAFFHTVCAEKIVAVDVKEEAVLKRRDEMFRSRAVAEKRLDRSSAGIAALPLPEAHRLLAHDLTTRVTEELTSFIGTLVHFKTKGLIGRTKRFGRQSVRYIEQRIEFVSQGSKKSVRQKGRTYEVVRTDKILQRAVTEERDLVDFYELPLRKAIRRLPSHARAIAAALPGWAKARTNYLDGKLIRGQTIIQDLESFEFEELERTIPARTYDPALVLLGFVLVGWDN